MAFEIGHKWSTNWTLENALPRFEDALIFATKNEDCLCMQEAVLQTGIPSRTFYELSKNHNILQSIKDEIAERVVIRVNKLAMKDQAPAAPAIWRMKQLGERDESTVNQKVQAKAIDPIIWDE